MKTFEIPEIYKSDFISKIKEKRRLKDKLKKDLSPSVLDFGMVKISIARHFGFCFGVENAVEIAYKTLESNPGKRIYLLSEMIHNPEVNSDLLSRGVEFLMDTKGHWLKDIETLQPEDLVIVPAFGTTIDIQKKLEEKGINPYLYDTTCPFVEKVWNRAKQIGEKGYTVIIHGKPDHEETRATFSHSKENGATLILKDLNEAKRLAQYILREIPLDGFYEDFKDRFSSNFNPENDLQKIGVVNQTTMLASETQEIADFLKNVLLNIPKKENIEVDFANTRDTLCYATNDNQDATYELMKHSADFAIVVGGYNSSNTSHIVELLEKKFKTYFIKSPDCIINHSEIIHFDLKTQNEMSSVLPIFNHKPTEIILTCGASCPDAIVEMVLMKLLDIFNIKPDLDVLLAKL